MVKVPKQNALRALARKKQKMELLQKVNKAWVEQTYRTVNELAIRFGTTDGMIYSCLRKIKLVLEEDFKEEAPLDKRRRISQLEDVLGKANLGFERSREDSEELRIQYVKVKCPDCGGKEGVQELADGVVYVVTCKVNRKQYVGATTILLSERRKDHEKDAKKGLELPFYVALRKHGFSNFEWGVLAKCEGRDALQQLEKFYIEKLETQVPMGYNKSKGGEGSLGGRDLEVGFEGNLDETEFREKVSCETCKGTGKITDEVISRRVVGQAGDPRFMSVAVKCIEDISRLNGHFPEKGKGNEEKKEEHHHQHLHLGKVDPEILIQMRRLMLQAEQSKNGNGEVIDVIDAEGDDNKGEE